MSETHRRLRLCSPSAGCALPADIKCYVPGVWWGGLSQPWHQNVNIDQQAAAVQHSNFQMEPCSTTASIHIKICNIPIISFLFLETT